MGIPVEGDRPQRWLPFNLCFDVPVQTAGGCFVMIVDDMQNPADKHVCSRLPIHLL